MKDYNSTVLTEDNINKSIDDTLVAIDTIVKEKYLNGDEKDYNDAISRVSDEVSKTFNKMHATSDFSENIQLNILSDMEELLKTKKFIPGGSIISGTGVSDFKSSLSNCYTISLDGDSLPSIGKNITDMMVTYSYRGGCGVDVSVLRPNGYKCNNAARKSTGAVSFIPMLSMVTRTIGQHGRRGALMVSLHCDHPDLMPFVWLKGNTKRSIYTDHMDPDAPNCNRANVSVQVSHRFMKEAMDPDKFDTPWETRFPDIVSQEHYDNMWDGDFDKWDKEGGSFMYYDTHFVYVCKDTIASCLNNRLCLSSDDNLCAAFEKAGISHTEIKDCKKIYKLEEQHLEVMYNYVKHKTYEYEFMNPSARDILYQISEAATICGDPGILFIDNSHDQTYTEVIDPKLKIKTTNPCGEILLPAGKDTAGNCLLGAHVLSEYVTDPWTDDAEFDMIGFAKACQTAVFLMDTFCENNMDLHPLQIQKDADRYGRRLGIEFTGLADMLSMLGLDYGASEDTLEFLEEMLYVKTVNELYASVILAHKASPCPACDPSLNKDVGERIVNHQYWYDKLRSIGVTNIEVYRGYADPSFFNAGDFKALVVKYGMRNIALNTVGPTGSLSLIAGNCSSGIEPVFAIKSTRSTRIGEGGTYDFIHVPLANHLKEHYVDELNNGEFTIEKVKKKFHIVEAHDLDYKERIELQATVQKYIDNSISSTINMPRGTSPDTVMDAYILAYTSGCKGITIFVDGSKDGVIKVAGSDNKEEPKTIMPATMVDLGETTNARCHKVRWNKTNIYVTVCTDDNNTPITVFTTVPREMGIDKNGIFDDELYNHRVQQWEMTTRLTSLCLRWNVPLGHILKQLRASSLTINDPLANIVRVLETYQAGNYDNVEELKSMTVEEQSQSDYTTICPGCGMKTYTNTGGCGICCNPECSYSSCS